MESTALHREVLILLFNALNRLVSMDQQITKFFSRGILTHYLYTVELSLGGT